MRVKLQVLLYSEHDEKLKKKMKVNQLSRTSIEKIDLPAVKIVIPRDEKNKLMKSFVSEFGRVRRNLGKAAELVMRILVILGGLLKVTMDNKNELIMKQRRWDFHVVRKLISTNISDSYKNIHNRGKKIKEKWKKMYTDENCIFLDKMIRFCLILMIMQGTLANLTSIPPGVFKETIGEVAIIERRTELWIKVDLKNLNLEMEDLNKIVNRISDQCENMLKYTFSNFKCRPFKEYRKVMMEGINNKYDR